jgi:NDP-sugar pyrophosphorylase family protein
MRSERTEKSAVVLAGGEGKRLQPYTTVLPKPLMPLDDRPILEIVLRQLGRAGFTDVVLAVGHLAELIQAFVGDGERFGVRVRYSLERDKLGTAGPIAAIDELPDDFLVMNGDVLCDFDYASLFDAHIASGASLTIAAYEKSDRIDFGVLDLDGEGNVISYVEKPARTTCISTGIYVVSSDAISLVPKGKRFDFPDLVAALLANESPVRAITVGGIWLDIGRKNDYEEAIDIYSRDPSRFLPG